MERERVTISIKKDILKKVDQTVDGVSVRNRSHAIEHLVSNALGETIKNDAVILVGGKGAQKLLPVVKQALGDLKDSGFEKVYIALGALASNMKENLGDGEDLEIDIEYLEEGEGTAGALLPLKKRFKNTFIVVNPDLNTPKIDVKNLIEYHKGCHGIATIGTNDLTSMKGFYVFEPSLFKYIPEDFSMLEDDIFPKLKKENKLVIYSTL